MTIAVIIAIIIVILMIIIMLYQPFSLYEVCSVNAKVNVTSDQDFINNAKPGDILLGHWNYVNPIHNLILNRAYTALTGDIYTHVAVVVQDPETNLIYVYDNYPEPRYDDYFQRMKYTGPALMLPEKYLARYDGQLFWLPRNNITIDELTTGWQYIMNNAYKTFDRSKWRMINSILKIGSNPRRTYRSLFCSENVAEILNFYGMNFSNPNIINPQDIKNSAITSDMYSQKIWYISYINMQI